MQIQVNFRGRSRNYEPHATTCSVIVRRVCGDDTRAARRARINGELSANSIRRVFRYCRWAKQYKNPGFKSWRCLFRWMVLTDEFADGDRYSAAVVFHFVMERAESIAARQIS